MDVRRTQPTRRIRIGAWFDGAKSVSADRVGPIVPETLEVGIERKVVVAMARVVVATVGVGLPDFDPRPIDRPADLIENSTPR